MPSNQPKHIPVGSRYSRLVVIGIGDPKPRSNGKSLQSTSLCQCDCGNTATIVNTWLRNGNTRSCGCLKKDLDKTRIARVYPDVGAVYGRWTIVENTVGTNGSSCSRCRCECGMERTIASRVILNGKSTSCGCLRREVTSSRMTTHGCSKRELVIPEYHTYINIKDRCYDETSAHYHNYGGRGIVMCDRWKSDFSAFLADIGHRPSDDHSVDRIDNDGNYACGNCEDCRSRGTTAMNCRWATRDDQARNKRTNRFVTVRDVTMCFTDMCWSHNILPGTVRHRMKSHPEWTLEQALGLDPIDEKHKAFAAKPRSREGKDGSQLLNSEDLTC